MKSNICCWLISTFLCINATLSYACGPYEFYPYGYKMFRVFDKSSVALPDERKENCILWQRLTSSDIPLEDIEKVVYKYSLAQMKEMMSVCDPNVFATWIRENNDAEIYDFLTLAKKCEYSRGLMDDPWYYPSKNDGTYMSLMDIVKAVKEYNGTRLRDRYALQAVRAMFSAGQYKECIDYWRKIEDSLPDGLIKEMTRSYMVGAYSRTGQIDYALDYFTKVEDLNSIIYCLYRQGKIKDEIDELECIAKYAPDSYQIPEILQRIISGFEPWGAIEYSYEYRRDSTMVSKRDRKLFNKLYKLATGMTKSKSLANKAVWCYTAAFLADLDAKSYDAWMYIQQASRYPVSEYMQESIRIMKMYLDSKVSSYNSAYESRLHDDLKWLENKIKGNINTSVKDYVSDMYIYRSFEYNISFYYWNDMLRRILLAEVCPRMIDRGMPVRALQLANMADNFLLNLVDRADGMTLKEYRYADDYNSIDYRSDFFSMMLNSVSISQLISYVARTQSDRMQFDSFLNKRGLIDLDYFYDVVGTRYIKEMNYEKAVKYLKLVSSSYQSRLNTEVYMDRDPFSINEADLENYENYKLRFATEMLRLEKSIAQSTDNSKKALDMIRYGTGLRNSYTYCWTLTEYRRTGWYYDLYELAKPVFNRVESIYEEALSLIDNDELAAAAHVQLCQWKTAVEDYPDTYAAKYTKMVCDNLCDYSIKWVVRTTYDW